MEDPSHHRGTEGTEGNEAHGEKQQSLLLFSLAVLCVLCASVVKPPADSSPGPSGEQCAVAVEVQHEGIDGQQRGDGEGHGHEPAVELVPEVGEGAVLPAHRLPRVTEGKPENDGADE